MHDFIITHLNYFSYKMKFWDNSNELIHFYVCKIKKIKIQFFELKCKFCQNYQNFTKK